MRKLLETKLYSRILIKRINAWAVHLVRYWKSFFEVDKKGTSTNGIENKKTHANA